jgi:hypothetical protein
MTTTRFCFWVLASFCAGGLSIWADDNLVTNGGFESGNSPWWGGGQVVTDGVAEGSAALEVADGFACQDKIPVQGGKRYRISLKIRTQDAPDNSVYVQVSYRGGTLAPDWYGPANVTLSDHAEKALFLTGGTAAWKDFTIVVTAPDDANQMLLYLRKLPGTAGAGFFDAVKVAQTDDGANDEAPVTTALLNGGFETGKDPWWGGGAVVTDQAAEGKASLQLADGFACQDKIPVEGGKRYRISMKIRAQDAPDRSVYVQLSYRGGDLDPAWYGPDSALTGNGSETALFVTGGTHEWREFSAVTEAPPTAKTLLLYLRKLDKTPGTAFFDDVKLDATNDPATLASDLKRGEVAAKTLPAALPAGDAAAALQKIVDQAKQPTPTKLTLARDGAPLYQVHVGTNADLIVLNSAQELARDLAQISGGTASALSDDAHPTAGPLLIIGKDNDLTPKLCPDIPYDSLGEDGFVIRTVGPDIIIAGNTAGGTMYGVNWFLDHKVGVKWLSPDYTYVPSHPTIEVDAVNEKQIPRFTFRQILSTEGQDKPFAAHNLLNGNSHGAQGILSPPEIDHWDSSWQKPGLVGSFYDLLPPAQFQAAHPDWYASGQLAMMNNDMRQALADAVVNKLKGVANYQNYWFGLMDNDWGWDIDPASADFARDHGGVPSAAQTDMIIDVFQRVRKVLPGAKIAFNAYHWGFTPPTNMTLPEGILVFPMTIHLDYSTPLFTGRNEKLGQDIVGWNGITKNILLWDHITNFNGYIQPTPNIYPICETIRWLATLPNIHGYFAEGSWNTKDAEFASLRVWIMARMLWDPATDYKAEIAEYCNDYYGAAGPLIKQYIDLMHESSAATHAPIWEKTNIDSAMLTLDFVTKADALMDKAQAAVADNPELVKHVLQVRKCVDYVILVRRKEYVDEAAAEKKDFNLDFANRLARFNQTLKDEGFTQYRQDGTMDELAGMIAIERKDSTPPDLVRDLPKTDWKEVQEIGFNRYYDKTVVIADPAASDGATARMDGSEGAPLIQLKHHKLPEEGLWDIYADVRVDTDGPGRSGFEHRQHAAAEWRHGYHRWPSQGGRLHADQSSRRSFSLHRR